MMKQPEENLENSQERTSKAPGAICWKCPLYDRPMAKTAGPENAKVAVVSRSPGYHEAMAGRAFSGPSGKVLDHLLNMQGVSRNEIITTNTVLCQSDDVPGLAIECCRPRLEAEVKNCETVIAAGKEATWVLTGESSVGRNRGFVHSVNGHRIVVTTNPAMVLRDDRAYPEMVRDFRLALNPKPIPKLPQVNWTDDVVEARRWYDLIVPRFTPGTVVACDIETRNGNEIVCVGFSINGDKALVFGEQPCADKDFLGKIGILLTIIGVRYVWHNGKYDVKVLRRNGINARVDEDTMLLSYALDERPGDPESGAGGHSLEWLLKDEFNWGKYEDDSVREFKKTGIPTNPPALYQYNGYDTAGTRLLYDELVKQAKLDNVYERPYKLMLIRLSEALTKVELEGTLYDAEAACDILESVVWPKLDQLKQNMRTVSGVSWLNPNSPKQIEELLYDKWGITHTLQRPRIETVGKRSVDQAVREQILKKLYAHDPYKVHEDTVQVFTESLDEFKALDKQRGTYLEGLVLKRAANGRIYTEFKIHGTESGRLSGANPNMQNITRPKDGLPNIRRVFIPDPGCSFISADLSQAELRAIAVLSNDRELKAVYLDSDRSLHREVAAEFYGKDFTHEQYVRSKNINFGVVYWQSAHSFSQMYHMPMEEAQRFIDFWWSRFPGVWGWTKDIERKVLTAGEIQSPFGHKRRFYIIPNDQSARIHMVKQGINFLPQNVAGNLTNWAMIRLCEDLDWRIAQVRINVHDNIVLNCNNDHIEEVSTLVKQTMENAAQEVLGWEFPFLAEVSTGSTWGDLEK